MTTPALTQEEKLQLLQVARGTIASCFENGFPGRHRHKSMDDCILSQIKKYQTLDISILKEALSCFVTLHSFESGQKQLRGCIGTLEARKGESLLENLISNSLAAAFRDNRFELLQAEELDIIKIEISILSKPVSIHFTNQHELFEKISNKGVILQSGYHRATFLPQVWEQLPKPDEFLKHLFRKAGLFSEDYLSASYQIYEVYAFEEE